MDWFALSSKFYIELDDEGVSEAAQTLLVRALAYMADNETSGYLAKTALKKFGLRSVSRRVDELIRNGIMTESSDGLGYDFPAWFKWNEPLERQVRKRKADRERVRKRREKVENVARHSREKSAMSHGHSNNYIKERTSVEEASPVSNAGEVEEQRPTGPAINVEGWKLVRDIIPASHPQATKSMLAQEAGGLILGGTPSDDIRAALELWLTKPNLGPRTLPSLVSEVIRTRDRPHPTFTRPTGTASTADQRFAQAQALKDSNGSAWPGSPLELT